MKKLQAFSLSVYVFAQFLVLPVLNGNARLLANERPPIPSKEEQKTVQKEIKEFYKTELQGARSIKDKKILARQLLADAEVAVEDSSAKYALLRTAQNLSSETKDLELGLEVADSIAASFLISQGRARAEVIALLAKAKGKFDKVLPGI